MDKAPAYGAGDCRFESCLSQIFCNHFFVNAFPWLLVDRLPGNFGSRKPMIFINCFSFWFVFLFNALFRSFESATSSNPTMVKNFFSQKNAKNRPAGSSSGNKNNKNSINGPFLPNLHPFYENLSNSGLSIKSSIVRKITSTKKFGELSVTEK